jgi:hypothetical protein
MLMATKRVQIHCRADLLPRHRNPEAFLRVDVLIGVLGVRAQIDPHPVDLAVEHSGVGGVVGADSGARLAADVRRLVRRENDALRSVDPTLADFLARIKNERIRLGIELPRAVAAGLRSPRIIPRDNGIATLTAELDEDSAVRDAGLS